MATMSYFRDQCNAMVMILGEDTNDRETDNGDNYL